MTALSKVSDAYLIGLVRSRAKNAIRSGRMDGEFAAIWSEVQSRRVAHERRVQGEPKTYNPTLSIYNDDEPITCPCGFSVNNHECGASYCGGIKHGKEYYSETCCKEWLKENVKEISATLVGWEYSELPTCKCVVCTGKL